MSPDVAREDMQHCYNRVQRLAVVAPAAAVRFSSVKIALKMMLFCGVLYMYTVLLGTAQVAAEWHNHKGNISRVGKIIATDSASSVKKKWGSRSFNSALLHSGNTRRSKYRPVRVKHTVPLDRQDDLLDGKGASFLGTSSMMQHRASVTQQATDQATQRESAASNMAIAGSWRKLQSISNHVGDHRSLSSVREEETHEAAAPHNMVPVHNSGEVASSLSQPSFLHTAAGPTAAEPSSTSPPGDALPAASSVSFAPPQANQAFAATPLAFSSPAVPPAGQPPTVPTPTIAPPTGAALAVAPPPAVPALTGAVPTATPSSTLTIPGTVATTGGTAASPGVALTAAVAPVAVLAPTLELAGQQLPPTSPTGATAPATGETTLPEAAVSTVVPGGGSIPVHGVVTGQPEAFAPQSSPAGAPLLPPSGLPSVTDSTGNPAVVMVPVASTAQNVAPLVLGAAPLLSAAISPGVTASAVGGKLQGEGLPQQQQEGQTQLQQPRLVTGEIQSVVQPHGVQQQPQVQQVGEETAGTTGKGEPSVLVYDRGTRVGVASTPFQAASRGDTRHVCFDACECWPVWASSIAVFVVYSAATLVAVLMTASLFSKGLRSSNFYKGGGYWLLGATAAGGGTGALIGALVARCVGASLGLAAGMMCLAASLVLVGRRGAWLGALGGVMTGGVIGAMINGGATPIALGAGIGLLLGVISGFVPLARQLKMNERYIRRGIAQGAAAPSPAPSRAVQRLSSNPISRIRSNMGLAPAAALPADRGRSLGSDAGPLVVTVPGATRDTETGTTASVFSSALAGRSTSGSLGEHSDAT